MCNQGLNSIAAWSSDTLKDYRDFNCKSRGCYCFGIPTVDKTAYILCRPSPRIACTRPSQI